MDNKIDRKSFTGLYHVDPITNRPQNPMGRTGGNQKTNFFNERKYI